MPRAEIAAFYQRLDTKIVINKITFNKITGELLVNISKRGKIGILYNIVNIHPLFSRQMMRNFCAARCWCSPHWIVLLISWETMRGALSSWCGAQMAQNSPQLAWTSPFLCGNSVPRIDWRANLKDSRKQNPIKNVALSIFTDCSNDLSWYLYFTILLNV